MAEWIPYKFNCYHNQIEQTVRFIKLDNLSKMHPFHTIKLVFILLMHLQIFYYCNGNNQRPVPFRASRFPLGSSRSDFYIYKYDLEAIRVSVYTYFKDIA